MVNDIHNTLSHENQQLLTKAIKEFFLKLYMLSYDTVSPLHRKICVTLLRIRTMFT